MRVQLIELGVGEAVVQQPLEQISVWTAFHSIVTNFRISSRIIVLTWLFAV
jgi:hypothetical protein